MRSRRTERSSMDAAKVSRRKTTCETTTRSSSMDRASKTRSVRVVGNSIGFCAYHIAVRHKFLNRRPNDGDCGVGGGAPCCCPRALAISRIRSMISSTSTESFMGKRTQIICDRPLAALELPNAHGKSPTRHCRSLLFRPRRIKREEMSARLR